MANYANLITAIQNVVKTNGNNEITGALLQQSLLAIINSLGADYQFVGVATPSATPGTPDQKVAYIASTPGVYANFGNYTVGENDVVFFKYNGSWTREITQIANRQQVNELKNRLDQISGEFVPVDSSFYVGDYMVRSTGVMESNSAHKLYRIPINTGEKIVARIYNIVTAAVLSFSTEITTTSVSLVALMGTRAYNYFSFVARANGYVYICAQRDTELTYKVIKGETPLEMFGVRMFTYGENILDRYIGSSFTDTTLWGSGYLNSSGTVVSASGYHYTKDYIPAIAGAYISRFNFSGNARIIYYDEQKNVIGTGSGGNATESRARTAPENTAFIRICTSDTDTNTLAFIYQDTGTLIVNVPQINELDERVTALENRPAPVTSIDNNLINEKEGADGWSVNDGSTTSLDNYGKPNVQYVIPVDNEKNVFHIKFRFRFTRPLQYIASTTNQPILSVGTTSSFGVAVRQQATNYDSNAGILNRRQYFIVRSGSNINSVTLENSNWKQWGDTPVFLIQYKGDDFATASTYILSLKSTSIDILDSSNNVLESIAIDTDELVGSVIDKINNTSNYIRAEFIQVANLKYTDCMLYSTGVSLTRWTASARPWIVYKLKDDSWHNLECVVDYNNLMAYTCIDGVANNIAIANAESRTVRIGGTVSGGEYAMTPIDVRDLHIGYDYEDAEIITYPQNVSGTLTRLISNSVPYLMIFEGHGIENKMNKDMPTGSTAYMATSTDTLRTVFAYLKEKGFKAVSWQDVVQWKKNGKALPKRCFTLMFDDFYIDNFMDLAKRKPFVEYGVKPGLAIITGENGETRSRNEQVTIDGQTWTLGEVFDAIIRGGWYPCSHTKNHTVLNDVSESNLLSMTKECIYSCDKLGIYDDVLVYPTGVASVYRKQLLRISGFAIGVQVSVNGYNCLGSLDFNLIRNEIGSRKDINDILAQIV